MKSRYCRHVLPELGAGATDVQAKCVRGTVRCAELGPRAAVSAKKTGNANKNKKKHVHVALGGVQHGGQRLPQVDGVRGPERRGAGALPDGGEGWGSGEETESDRRRTHGRRRTEAKGNEGVCVPLPTVDGLPAPFTCMGCAPAWTVGLDPKGCDITLAVRTLWALCT